jgi:hypothetical protein
LKNDVFISYSSKDRKIVDKIYQALKNEGLTCWIAPNSIEVGDVWGNSIFKAIPNSKAFLLVLSSSSNDSQQVLREVGLAVDKKSLIIPVRIEDIEPTEAMNYFLNVIHRSDLLDLDLDLDNFVQEVKAKIRNKSNPVENNTSLLKKEKKIFFKKKFLIILLILIFGYIFFHQNKANIISYPSFSSEKNTSNQKKEKRSIDISILKEKSDGTFSNIKQNGILSSGDSYQILIKSYRDGYLYVYQKDASGNKYKLFPNNYYRSANIYKGEKKLLPSKLSRYVLDYTIGKEKFYFILLEKPFELSEINLSVDLTIQDNILGVADIKDIEKHEISIGLDKTNNLDNILKSIAQNDINYTIGVMHK